MFSPVIFSCYFLKEKVTKDLLILAPFPKRCDYYRGFSIDVSFCSIKARSKMSAKNFIEFASSHLCDENGAAFRNQVWIQSGVCPCSQASLLTALAKNNHTGLFF